MMPINPKIDVTIKPADWSASEITAWQSIGGFSFLEQPSISKNMASAPFKKWVEPPFLNINTSPPP